MTKIKQWWINTTPRFKASITSAWQGAAAALVLVVFGFLADVQEWAGGTSVDFPSVNPLGKAVVSALVGAVTGVIAAIYRTINPPSNTYGVVTVREPAKDEGTWSPPGGFTGVLIVILVILAILWLVGIRVHVG